MKRRQFLKSTAFVGGTTAVTGLGCDTSAGLPTFRPPLQGNRTGRRVAVLGSGVGGMSTAHELSERGFEVTIFERLSVPGGQVP